MAETPPPPKPDKVPESPTTARPLDFDDEQQESGVVPAESIPPSDLNEAAEQPRSDSRVRFAEDEDAPPKPPRPVDPKVQAENTLLEAFPSIDPKVVKAILMASGGQVEPAFNALLGMSDPSFKEEAPPPQPPRTNTTAAQRQMEQDEMYARQLAEHYNSSRGGYGSGLAYGELPQRQDSRGYQQRPGPNYQGARRGERQPGYDDPEDKDYSFFDDELPQIRENLKQGFLQTQSKVNKWISDFSKRMDRDDSEDDPRRSGSIPPRQNFGPSQSDQLRGIRQNADAMRARRSTDYDRYDADPQVLNDNFEGLEMRDEEADEQTPPPKPARPSANPNLFKPTPQPPQSGPVDEIDAALYSKPPNPGGLPTNQNQTSPAASAAKGRKWQPLTSIAPAPEAEDNDPFALGDSDDDKTTDIKAADTERLKSKAAGNKSKNGAGQDGKELEATETTASGTRNKEVEEILSKTS